MATKRVAGHQITKDEYDASENRDDDSAPVVAGKWKEASEETLAARQFASVKRKPAGEGEEKSSFPTFNLTNTESAPPTFNAFAKFAAAPGEWECPSCEVRNKKEAKKCAACEAKNPNAEEGDDEKSTADKTASLFTFGAPPAGGGESATFANPFGSGTFNFSNNVTFGTVSGEGASSGFGTGTFEFKDSAPLENSAAAAGPVEAFKDAKPAPTGEEGETSLLKVHGKAYILSDVAPEKPEGEEGKEAAASSSEKKKKFQEVGEGDLHLNTKEEDGKPRARFVMRADKTQRLILNCALFKAMKVEAQGDKYVRFPSFGEDGKIECHLLKFKSKGEVDSVVEAANKAIAALH